jgi:hypothetical protein
MMLQPVGKAQGKRITRAPFDEHAAAAIFHTLQRQFAHWHKRLLHNLHNEWAKRDFSTVEKSIAKADDDRQLSLPWIDAAIADAIDEPSAASMRDVADAMAQAHTGAAGHTIKQLDIDDPNALLLRSQTEAVNYAAARSAELVGRRYNADGNLVDNPNADWAITSTSRDVLRREIRDAVATDRDVDRLADRITDTGIFADDRAEMIARTEMSMAQNAGTLEAGRQAAAAGLNVRKIWTLGPNPCPLCEDAAAEGDIDLEDDFGGEAGDAPPLHPNCECSLDLFVADDQEEEEPEEEESEMKHASARRFERFKNDAAADEDETDNGDSEQRHVIDRLADWLVEAGDGEVSRESALNWLLHDERGQALIRMAQHRKRATGRKGFQMTRNEELRALMKARGGVHGLAKYIAATGTASVTEHELTQLIVDAAKREHPDLSDAQAFAKMFCGPTGATLQRAVAIAKAQQLEIMPDATEADQDDSGKATRQMERLVDEQIRRSPEMTRSQAWNVVVHENPMLAAAAIRRPQTNKANAFPFPR